MRNSIKTVMTALLLLSMAGSAMCLPSTFDWRDVNGTNYVTPVRDQGRCGSCGVFAAVAAVESSILIEYPHITDIDLSEQFSISDCVDDCSCGGTHLSDVISPMQYLGVPLESCIPYLAKDSSCNCCETWQDGGWRIENRTELGYCSTGYYKTKLMENGPMAAVVFTDEWCDPDMSEGPCGYHGVLIIGWNDSEGVWIAKNSYGANWGNEGYGKILFNRLGKLNRDVYIVSGAYRIYSTYPADVTGDGCVDVSDIVFATDRWGHYESPADVSGSNYGIPDLTVDVLDLIYIIDNWGPCLCPCGDVTIDGSVNMGDVTMLSDFVTYGSPVVDAPVADVTGDGYVNTLDVTRLFDYITYGSPLLNCQY